MNYLYLFLKGLKYFSSEIYYLGKKNKLIKLLMNKLELDR